MSDIPQLTLTFLDKHPLDAARILELVPPENTVAFFQEIPLNICCKIFEKLLPEYAALCLKASPASFTVALAQEMSIPTVATIFRFLPDLHVKNILMSFSEQKRAVLKRQLIYPNNTVGAWMNTQIIEVPKEFTVGETRKFLRRSGRRIEKQIYAVNSDKTLEGIIELSTLVIAKDSLPISKFIIKDFFSLNEKNTLRRLKLLADWERFETLPVIDNKGHLLGVLSKTVLESAFNKNKHSENSLEFSSALMNLTQTYTSTLSLFVGSIISFFDQSKNKKKYGI